MADGNIACADFTSIQVMADQIWANSAKNKQFIAKCDALKAVLFEQTTELVPILDPDKDLTVKIQWVDMCDNTVENLDPDCVFVGAEGEATCLEHTITEAKQSVFSALENKFRGSTMDIQMFIAKGWLTAKKLLDEEMTKSMIAKIDGFVGENEYLGAPGQVVGTDTFIPPAHWGPEIMAYFAQASIINMSSDTYILDGDNLFRQTWLADFKALNQNEKDGKAMLETIRTYHDLFNMAAIVGAQKLFLIDKSAVTHQTKNRYSTAPRNILNGADRIRFAVPSDNLPGVVYDVVYTTECLPNEDIRHNWKFIARFDTFLNPTSACNPTNTGVLSFTCGEAP